MNNFWETLYRNLKKVNVERKQKKKGHEMRKKAMKRFGEAKQCMEKDESDIGDERCSSEVVGFLWEKIEQDCEFKSEKLQEEKKWKESSGKTA